MADETNAPEDQTGAPAQAEPSADALSPGTGAPEHGARPEGPDPSGPPPIGPPEAGAGHGDASGRPSLDIVLDVPVTLSLEVGRATMSVGDLLNLGQGAVVELDRAVGEPLDVLVNGALVARGEIVLVNEKFGIRLTSIIEPAETARKSGTGS